MTDPTPQSRIDQALEEATTSLTRALEAIRFAGIVMNAAMDAIDRIEATR